MGFLLLFTAIMYTCTRLLILFLLSYLTACRHKPSIVDKGEPITDAKQLTGLAGTWYATPDTYTMLLEKRYKPDSIYMELQADSVLKARHLPDCMNAAFKAGTLQDAIGLWKLHRDGDDWKMSVAFEAGQLFRYKTHVSFDIVLLDSALTIYQYIGDPDDGHVLRFIKAR